MLKDKNKLKILKVLYKKTESNFVFIWVKNIIFRFFTLIKRYILILLLIASVYCVIRYSELPIIPFIPDIIAYLFIKPTQNTTLYEVFRLLENLSLAYIASYIFYLIIDYFPNKGKEIKALELVKGELNFIHFNMGDLIMRINAVTDIPENINNITLNDLQKLDNFVFSNETLYFNKYSFINEEKKITSRYTENFYSYSANNIKNIVSCIRKIKTIPCAIYIDFDILELLSAVETNWFINWILNLKPEEINQQIVRMGFSNDYYEFIQSYKNLCKMKFVRKNMENTEIMSHTQKMEFIQNTENFGSKA